LPFIAWWKSGWIWPFFEGKYRNDETGRAAYDPKILLKIVLLAYSRGLVSSRKIEPACRENVVFIALACGQQPDHSTIAALVSSLKDETVDQYSCPDGKVFKLKAKRCLDHGNL
jgi:hypothetical protein